jgi:glyoxylase-like metal-dependent hydrolase (beta-lactamase superfamily II)
MVRKPTHLSIAHAEAIRHRLHAMAVRSIRVVLSHWHDDHSGNEVFADCEMIANAFTATALAGHRETFESGNPPIKFGRIERNFLTICVQLGYWLMFPAKR